MTLQEVQARLVQAEHSIRVLTEALEAERERARDRMTVWDHYAGAALSAIVPTNTNTHENTFELEEIRADCVLAGKYADAMLAERSKRGQP